MLLKKLQYKTRNRPAQTQVEAVYGNYAPKEQRNVKVEESRNAHFKMGNPDEAYQPRSSANEHFSAINLAQKGEMEKN